jgi:hypothetical protein
MNSSPAHIGSNSLRKYFVSGIFFKSYLPPVGYSRAHIAPDGTRTNESPQLKRNGSESPSEIGSSDTHVEAATTAAIKGTGEAPSASIAQAAVV